jgi:hypothetical protein
MYSDPTDESAGYYHSASPTFAAKLSDKLKFVGHLCAVYLKAWLTETMLHSALLRR